MLERKFVFDYNKFASFLLVYFLFFIPISYYFGVFIQLKLGMNFGVAALTYGFALIFSIYVYFMYLKKINIIVFVLLNVFLWGTIFYCLIYSSNMNLVFTSFFDIVYNPSITLFFYCIPILIISVSGVVDFEIVYKYITVLSRIIIIVLILYFFVFNIGWGIVAGQYMTTSYYALPSLCICMLNHSRQNKLVSFDGILALIGMILILVGGARGALVCSTLFGALLVLVSPSNSNKKKLIVSLLCILFVVFLLLYFNRILSLLESYLSSIGVDSRTISKFGDNTFYKSNDRIRIWTDCMNAVWKSPILGYGLWGDRVIVGSYAHNLFIELMCSFGFFIGVLLSLIIILLLIRTIIKNSNSSDYKYYLFLIAIPYGLIQLMFSDSYLLNGWFFLLLGMLINYNRKIDFIDN